MAERLGRSAYGVERDPDRAAYGRSLLRTRSHLRTGGAKELGSLGFPRFDLSLTSPPYTSRQDPWNPLRARGGGGYSGDLGDLSKIFSGVGRLGKPGARVVLETSHIRPARYPRPTTFLAGDVAARLSKLFRPEGEIVIGWTGRPRYRGGGTCGHGQDHSYVVVFRTTR